MPLQIDVVSLFPQMFAAISEFEGIEKAIVGSGFGTDVEDKVCHLNLLRNMAALIQAGGFYGSCSLTPLMKSFRFYKMACDYVMNMDGHKISPIHSRIIPATEGQFGNFHQYNDDINVNVCISPLMSIYWFFNYQQVFNRNKILPTESQSFLHLPYVQSYQ